MYQLGPIRTRGHSFINGAGDEVFFKGINIVCKDKALGYVTPLREEDIKQLADHGFNLIRLGLQWDGVEKQPLQYDDSYLNQLKEQIQWAEKYGIYVFLDMHQDLYGIKFGDGAPLWATLDGGLEHVTGDLWADAYLLSPALMRAFDAFWHNEIGPKGIGIQDHFVEMWTHVADVFKDSPNVIGFDVFNEPYPGSHGLETFGEIAKAAEQLLSMSDADDRTNASNKDASSDPSLDFWTNEEEKANLLLALTDMNLYEQMAKAAETSSASFETNYLMPFYDRLYAAISSICPTWLFFQEANYFTNMGIKSSIQAVSNTNSVYAPHGYDLVVDTDLYEAYSKNRVEFIFNSHKEVQERLNLPTLIGEWGAFSHHPLTKELCTHLLDLFDKNLWSHSYWCWQEDIKDAPYWSSLTRAYPRRVSGQTKEITQDPQHFLLKLDAKAGTTSIYLPKAPQGIKANLAVETKLQHYQGFDAVLLDIIHGEGLLEIDIQL